MSTRDCFCSITSIEPIRAAVGLNDESLVALLVDKHAEQYGEHDLSDEVAQDDIEERRRNGD